MPVFSNVIVGSSILHVFGLLFSVFLLFFIFIACSIFLLVLFQLQDTETTSGESEVKFQVSRDTLGAMLRSMAYIREQLSLAVSVVALFLVNYVICHGYICTVAHSLFLSDTESYMYIFLPGLQFCIHLV